MDNGLLAIWSLVAGCGTRGYVLAGSVCSILTCDCYLRGAASRKYRWMLSAN